MNNSTHDKSLGESQSRAQFELNSLDRRRPVPDPHANFRDSTFDHSIAHRSQGRPIGHPPLHSHASLSQLPASVAMKSSVMHQPSGPLSSIPNYSSSNVSMAFPSLPDAQHSTNTTFIPQSNAAPHLPNALSLQHSIQQQQQNQQQQRNDVQQKMAPPQQQNMRRFHAQQNQAQQMMATKPAEQMQNVSQASILPQMAKAQPALHLIPQQAQMPHRFQQAGVSQTPLGQSRARADGIPSMPLPMHPDPIQTFQPSPEGGDGDRFSFARHGFFDEFSQEENPVNSGLPPPHVAQDSDQGNTLAGVDSITGHLGMQGVPTIASLPLPGISGGQSSLHGVAGFGAPTNMGNAAIAGGASEIADVLGVDRTRGQPFQRRMRAVPRARNQHMTESQRKQRHNEHTRASRSRIDRGLERLKNTIRKIRPQQKVSKKADVLQEAVKLLKEGFRLPATESDEEREEPQDSSLSV